MAEIISNLRFASIEYICLSVAQLIYYFWMQWRTVVNYLSLIGFGRSYIICSVNPTARRKRKGSSPISVCHIGLNLFNLISSKPRRKISFRGKRIFLGYCCLFRSDTKGRHWVGFVNNKHNGLGGRNLYSKMLTDGLLD